ncbi:MAG TPA: VWA domain-containing protein [Edaphobacter sp.]|nr:VWA domain-containing protein [Edaphobacter sp.]
MRTKLRYLLVAIVGTLACGAQSPISTVRRPDFLYIPTLVQNKSGEIIYDLSPQDFVVEDNGVSRSVTLTNDFHIRPIAMVLVVQSGRNAAAELQAVPGLSGLLDAVLNQPQDRVAIIAYDRQPRLIQDFTSDTDQARATLSELRPGDDGASLFDALHLALSVMKQVPDDEQKVILTVGGRRDHGSNLSDPLPLLQEIASQNLSVYCLAFTPRRSLTGDLHMLNPFSALAARENAAQSLAQLTGGDFYQFRNEKSFEERMMEVANHIHNRYMLRLETRGSDPGVHSVRVQVQVSGDPRVTARTAYFIFDKSGKTEAAVVPK